MDVRPDRRSGVEARDERILEVMLSMRPSVKERLLGEAIEKGIEQGIEKAIEQGIEKGRLAEARAALRQVLKRRQFVLSTNDEARIEACADVATLQRWLDQAVTASSAHEALQ